MMERLLQHGGWLKVISVGLAILLWATVVPRYTRQEERTFDVPLHVIYHPDFQVDQGPLEGEQKVAVKARGPNHIVARLKEQEIRAEVDYRRVSEAGKQTAVKVQVTGPERWRESIVFTVEQPTITVVLVALAESTVQVIPSMAPGVPSVIMQGGREWTYTVSPEVAEVTLRGRSDMLRDVTYARVVVDANDLVPGTTRVAKNVIPMNASEKSVDKINPAQVNVLLTWKELPPGKAFKVNPVTRGALPTGMGLVGVEVQPGTLIVRATTLEGKLPERELIDTEPIDLTSRTGPFTATVKVIPPTGTSVGVETVNVAFNIAEIPVEKTLKGLPVTVRGKATNAEVTLTVTDVQIKVRGPYSVVTPLEVGQFTAYVDVEGLAGGKHTIPVKIASPLGVTGLDIDPPAVDLTVSIP